MTTEEKLEKAVSFIKSIEKLDKLDYDTFDLKDIERHAFGYCAECDESVEVSLCWPSNASLNTKYIDYSVIDDIKDHAWHVLADITE